MEKTKKSGEVLKQSLQTNIHSIGVTIFSSLYQFIFLLTENVIDYLKMGIFSAKCLSTARLDGKIVVVTGCNTGIGKITAKDLFERGAKVIMACRNTEAANKTLNDIKNECENSKNCGELTVEKLDLSSLESVRNCAQNLLKNERKINLLINNAGIMMCPYSKTKDDYELQFGTNHLGHFLFTMLLLPKIIESKPARIVTISSIAHSSGSIDFDDINWEKKPYSALGAYQQSKLANVLFSSELARRFKENNIQNVNTYSLHPGVIATELGRHLNTVVPVMGWIWRNLIRRFLKTPEQGAQTTIYCAVDEECENETGLYYAECRKKEPSNLAKNEDIAKRLWEVSCDLVKLDKNYNPFETSK